VRSPVFQPPQVIGQATPPATGGLLHAVPKTLLGLLMQQPLKFAHGHRGGSVHSASDAVAASDGLNMYSGWHRTLSRKRVEGPRHEGSNSPVRGERIDGCSGHQIRGWSGIREMATKRPGIGRIVVGVDGSEHSGAALGWAVRMAKGMDSEVVAVFAISLPIRFDTGFMAAVPPVESDPEWRAEMKKEFEEEWCKPLRDAGVRYRTVMEDGRPASVIARVGDSMDADVIVVGRRGRGGVAELLLGSVSHELVLHSRRPILLVSNVVQKKAVGQAAESAAQDEIARG
jgi:nucleotide-binding universal stress UspA family protein